MDSDEDEPAIPGIRRLELVEEELEVDGAVLSLLRPTDPMQLIDEEAFARNEFLPYWAELWPSARALVDALPVALSGLRVLELGCGLGLPSLVAARRGARVLATDWAADALELLLVNAHRNALALEVAVLDWASPATVLSVAPFDLVLAADVLYERRNVPLLLDLFERLQSDVLLADPGRSAAAAFLEKAEARFSLDRESGGVVRLRPSPPPER